MTQLLRAMQLQPPKMQPPYRSNTRLRVLLMLTRQVTCSTVSHLNKAVQLEWSYTTCTTRIQLDVEFTDILLRWYAAVRGLLHAAPTRMMCNSAPSAPVQREVATEIKNGGNEIDIIHVPTAGAGVGTTVLILILLLLLLCCIRKRLVRCCFRRLVRHAARQASAPCAHQVQVAQVAQPAPPSYISATHGSLAQLPPPTYAAATIQAPAIAGAATPAISIPAGTRINELPAASTPPANV